MTPQELKNSILQLAIQGKLVEQRPEEGTGEQLYREILAEKAKLVKAGKIKQDKPLPEIAEDEKPFDIPESWKWCRITECGTFISGYTPHSNQLALCGTIPYFKVSDMNTEGNELWMSFTTSFLKDNDSSRTYLKNTIVYPKNGGAVFTNKKRILSQDSVVDLNTGGYYPYAPIDLMYMFRFFSSIDFRQCYKGTALPTIDMDKLRCRIIPLPPLAEQKRIVAKIEELLPYIDRYEQAWCKLEDFNKRFPGDMQKSILQFAIQGKLVEQRPEEGTGEALYRQIQAEKQRLIKAGTIKKEKPLPEIAEEEKPFEIPESWKWVRLGRITYKITDGTHKTPSYKESGVRFVSAKDISDGELNFQKCRYISLEEHVSLYTRCNPESGDLLVSKSGSIGTVVTNDYDFEFSLFESLALIKYGQSFFYPKFLKYSIQNACRYLSDKEIKGVAVKHLPIEAIVNMIIPLPPLVEQKRIVDKLEEILPLCEKLK